MRIRFIKSSFYLFRFSVLSFFFSGILLPFDTPHSKGFYDALDKQQAFGSRHYPLQNNGLHQCKEWDRPRPVAGSASLQSVAESYPSHQKFERKAKNSPAPATSGTGDLSYFILFSSLKIQSMSYRSVYRKS